MKLLLVDDNDELLDSWTMLDDPDILQAIMDELPDSSPTKAAIAVAYVTGN